MKIDVASIVRDHFETLYDGRSNRASFTDIAIFYIVPAIAAICTFCFDVKLDANAYNIGARSPD